MPGSGPGSGPIIDEELRESDDVTYADDDTLVGWRPTGVAKDLLDDPRNFILTVFVGAILSFVTAIYQLGLDGIFASSNALRRAGNRFLTEMETLWSTVTMLVVLPIESLDGLAASAGIFAPLVTALAFALTAAIVAGILWGLYRLVRFI